MPKSNPFKEYSRSKEFFCCITGEKISAARVEYLLSEGVLEAQLTSLTGAKYLHKPKKLIVIDDVGGEFICDHIDNTRAWEAERFGPAAEEVVDGDLRKSTKRLDDTLLRFEYETLEAYVKRQDGGDEEEEP